MTPISPLRRAADLLDWVAVYMARRRLRTFITAAGTCLGVAAFVAASSLTQTAAATVNRHFDELKATELRAVPQTDRVDAADWEPAALERRIRQITGVDAAGLVSNLPDGATLEPSTRTGGSTSEQIPLVALSRGALAAVNLTVSGDARVGFTAGDPASRAVLVGSQVADRLNMNPDMQTQQVSIDGVDFTVTGFVQGAQRRPDLMYSVVVPVGAAEDIWADRLDREVLVTVDVGAADVVAQQLPVAVAPAAPGSVLVVSPVEPDQVAGTVATDVRRLSLLVGAVLVLVGALSIAAVAYGAVNERTAEFGVRRAMGASAAHVGSLVVAEASVIGTLGGVLGSAVGVVATVLIALSQSWSPIIDSTVALVAPAVGLLVGLAAGAIPAIKAARLNPIDALRS